MIDILQRVADLLGYIELLERQLTPSEVKKVHALLVDVEQELSLETRIRQEVHEHLNDHFMTGFITDENNPLS